MKKIKKKNKKNLSEIKDYDRYNTTAFIDEKNPLKLSDLGFTIPNEKPSQVVSIRLPTPLLNALKSIGSQKDIPYQSVIKTILWDQVEKELRQ